MCAGAVCSTGGSRGVGWLGGLCQLLQGPCCHKGFGGVCRGFPGHTGVKALPEVRAATDKYVYKHI